MEKTTKTVDPPEAEGQDIHQSSTVGRKKEEERVQRHEREQLDILRIGMTGHHQSECQKFHATQNLTSQSGSITDGKNMRHCVAACEEHLTTLEFEEQ